jgi:hypothetical protein
MSTYSFMNVVATLVATGVKINLGQGAAVAEEGISIEMAGDKNTMLIGSDGEGMHSLHADKSGTVTVRLLKTSPVNAQLMAAYDLQTLTPTLHGTNVIAVEDKGSNSITTARNCAFKKKPAIKYSKDGDVLEWAFDSTKIDTILGTY